jgi:hypothetical protein
MRRMDDDVDLSRDQLLAELTDAAYRVTLQHGIRGAFLDVELDLWRALRWVLERASTEHQRVCQPELCLTREETSWQA